MRRARDRNGPDDALPPNRNVRLLVRAGLIATAVAVGCLVLVELLLALFGVAPVARTEDPYVGFSSWFPLFVEHLEPDGTPILVTADNKRNAFNAQRFSAEKPADTYRIFCLGGSTTYGRPYDDAVSYCAWLRAMLPKADPSRNWEVINAGGISYASYRISRLMEELIQYEPDLFIVYTGHNEFLEKRTFESVARVPGPLRDIGAVLSRTRLYAIAKRAADGLAASRPSHAENRPILPGEVDAMLDHSVGPEAYHRDDEGRGQVLAHFEFNLNRMVGLAQEAGAALIFITPASNLRDCAPFKSEWSTELGESARERANALLEQSRSLAATGQPAKALDLLDEAVAIDARHAGLQYRRGRALWNLGRFDEAYRAFIAARDEDVCPLRASTAVRRVVEDIADARNVPLVDFAAHAEGVSPHGVPGDNLFLDHVHPTVDGHRELALLLLDAMAGLNIVHPTGSWKDEAMPAVRKEVESRRDPVTEAAALRNLAKVLGWAGKFDEAYRSAQRAAATNPADGEAHYQAGLNAARLGRDDEALEQYRRAVAVEPGHARARLKLGNALSERGESDGAIRQFRALLDLGPEAAPLGQNNLGNEFAALGQYFEAIDHYRDAIALRPGYAEAHVNLGLALAAVGENAEAVAEYRTAIELNPDSAPGHYNLGLTLEAVGDLAAAVDAFRRAVTLAPDYPAAHHRLGNALAAAGRAKEALESLRAAIRLQPDYAAALSRMARILADGPDPSLHDPAQALRLAKRAVELTDGRDPDALAALATAYAAAGQVDDAARIAQAALALLPSGETKVRARLGRLLDRSGGAGSGQKKN